MRRHSVLLGLALLAGAAACGGDEDSSPAVSRAAQECREQWYDVAQSVLDMDTDPTPSALSERWSTVIAGVDYQSKFATGEDCAEDVEDQVRQIDALRRLSARLQVYDMEQQLRLLRPAAELYLSQERPGPYRDDNGVRVQPPAKPAVRQALATLADTAEQANEELAPAWTQATAVDLSSPESVRKVIRDLDRLATSSPAFGQCQRATQVLAAATAAQQRR